MSKELENLETLKDMLIGNGVNDNINDYVDNLILPIKQALLELKSIKEANPSEALKKLDDISYLVLNEIDDLENKEVWKSYFDTIKQALLKAQEEHKALEIINEKNVNIGLLKLSTNLIEYYTMVHAKTGENTELTEEEFATVKEVLKWLD